MKNSTKVGLSARSPPTVTEIDLVQNGTYAESTAYLEVANSRDYSRGCVMHKLIRHRGKDHLRGHG